MRLRHVDPATPGWTRRRSGRGFTLLDESGTRIADAAARERVRALAIPPAWDDVWICPWPNGHLQATGTDDAGRRQYLYHPVWQERRARRKHDHVLDVARRLPAARRRVTRDLARPGMPRERALALGFRLLDVAFFRVGGERYARDNGSFGLGTLLREHVTVRGQKVAFTYPAKSGQVRLVEVDDAAVATAVRALLRRDDDHPELLAWRDDAAPGRDGTPSDPGADASDTRDPATPGDTPDLDAATPTWRDVTTADLAGYVKDRLGSDATPKDLRTWHATVLAADGLARTGPPPDTARARRAAVTRVIREVAEELGNTPAVCRASYVDPRVIDLWERGELTRPGRTRAAAERAVLALLT